MSQTIDQAFVRQYEREVHLDYQRQGSKLRGTVRTVNGVRGSSTTFQIIGKGVAGSKARHGKVPVMNLEHTNVTVTLVDRYAGEFVDKLDELKINHDERSAISQSQAWALGRATDQDIIDALGTGSGNSTTITLTSERTVRNSLIEAKQRLMERDVPDDGWLFGVISPSMWAAFMTIEQFASADYVGPDLPYKGAAAMRSWLGFNWISHTGLGLATNTRTGFLYHKMAIGHAIGSDVQMDVTWQGERAAWFMNAMMSMNAVLIDNDGVEDLVIDESTALPST